MISVRPLVEQLSLALQDMEERDQALLERCRQLELELEATKAAKVKSISIEPLPDLLTVAECAAFAKHCTRTIRDAIRDQELTATKPRHKWLIERRVLMGWIAKRKTEPANEDTSESRIRQHLAAAERRVNRNG